MARYSFHTQAPPILLSPPHTPPDIRLHVFNQVFHAHSSVLKQHSAFFRTFLDSPDKHLSGTSSNPDFKYDWVTEIDKDKSWGLICITKTNPESPPTGFPSDFDNETKAFATLMRALYGLPLRIRSTENLRRVIKLADFYRALPKLSAAVTDSLQKGTCPLLLDQLVKNSAELLELATKLRSAVLFRECLLLCMGPIANPGLREIEDAKLKPLAVTKYNLLWAQTIQTKIIINNHLTHCPHCTPESKVLLDEFATFADSFQSENLFLVAATSILPHRIRKLREELLKLEEDHPMANFLGVLCGNGLTLIPERAKYLPNHFLNVPIDDDDLPWDIKQVDW